MLYPWQDSCQTATGDLGNVSMRSGRFERMIGNRLMGVKVYMFVGGQRKAGGGEVEMEMYHVDYLVTLEMNTP